MGARPIRTDSEATSAGIAGNVAASCLSADSEGGGVGVTETDVDAGPVPMAFVALTEQPYKVLLVSPETTMGLLLPLPDLEVPGIVQVAVYPVMTDPPSEVGAAKAIEACPSPGVTVVIVGAPGAVAVDGFGVGADPPPPPPQAASRATKIESRIVRDIPQP